MIAMYEKEIIDLKSAHAKLGGTGVWIDTGRFSKGTRLHNPNGLFDLFGEYSGQKAGEVRDLMVGWIYNNFRNVKDWTKMVMQHKNLEFDKWLENMQKSTTHGDDIALYILCRMFNKHAFVHNAMYGWSTMPYRREDNHADIVAKCDLELVFLKCWAFGEVKKIRGPTTTQQADNTPSTTDVIPGNVPIVDVIPGNVTRKWTRSSKTPQKKVTERTSKRRRPAIDYSKLGDTDDIPSPKRENERWTYCVDHQKPCWKLIKNEKRCHRLGLHKPNQPRLRRLRVLQMVPVLPRVLHLELLRSRLVQRKQKLLLRHCWPLEVICHNQLMMWPWIMQIWFRSTLQLQTTVQHPRVILYQNLLTHHSMHQNPPNQCPCIKDSSQLSTN